MATLSLKISLEGGKIVKTVQLEPSTTVFDACRLVRDKILEASQSDPKEYGLFLASEEDGKKGIWLDGSRTLDYYMLRNGDVLEYARKTRNLRVRMLDGSVKTLLVDDSQIVANLMVVICTKIGITNYEEYGLVREDKCEEPDPCDKPHYGTLTLRRKHQDKERDHKMDQLRKKLRTDDEVNWVEGGRTLREQGIEVSETLLLRRKLFFSDRNVDSRDPVQLNLLYVQARDAILDTTHPVTMDKACEFAGIQCQIQFGDHKEDKHTPGFLDLKEFLPASYVKVKGIEKKIFKEHKKHVGLSELDAKVLYTKTARDLKTYGVAFFLVKEKMKGKNKLVPRLLGVTKDSVLRLDEKTKEILQTWPLTTVRRWCASPNTFTLDFGDYSDQYYSVQTTEAEQILQVIAGYIDIIVRKRRAKEHLGIDGDEGSAMLEDSVSPNKANIIQHDTFKSDKVSTQSVAKPAVLRPGADGAKTVVVGHTMSAQQTTISGQIITGHTPPASGAVQQTRVTAVMSEPQRALLSTITTGKELIRRTQEELTRTSLGEIGADAESQRWRQSTLATNRHTVTSHIAAMNAATAQVVTLTAGPTEEVDHTAVGAAITTITSNLPEVTKGVQMIASLMEEEDGGDKLLDATRKLCAAFTDLLKAAEPDTKEPRQNLLNAASRVGEASTSVLTTIGEEQEYDKETQDILLSLAKGVANTTAALVLKAKNVAAQCRDEPAVQAAIIAAATYTALATSQLVATTKVVAPTIHSPECRAQLVNAARQVAAAVDRLVAACEPLRSSPAAAPHVDSLVDAARQVTDQLERLLAHAQLENGTHARAERTVETVVSASERVAGAGDAAEMVRHARALGSATATLITTIKTEAERTEGEQQRRLLAAAKLLADATARMVEAARQCATQPQDRERQEALRRAAEELRYITVDYAQGQDIVSSQLARLQETARAAASSATQLVTSSQHAAQYSSSKHVQETLVEETRTLYEHVPRVQDAVAHAAQQEHNPAAQIDLISASETFLQSSGHAISAARSALPTVTDVTAAKRLADTTHQFTSACADLRSAVSRARVSCKGLELDAAAETVRSLQRQLDEVDAKDLRPLPSQTAEWAAHTLSVGSRGAAGATAALVSGVRAGEAAECGRAAGDLAASLRQYTAGVRAAAALQPDVTTTTRVISSGQSVLETSLTLVETVKTYLTTTERVDTASIVTIARDLSHNLERTMEAIPSHAELDEALANVTETLTIIEEDRFPASSAPYRELQSSLESAAAELNAACCDVVETVDSAPELGRSSQRFGDAFNRLLSTSMEMCSQTEELESRTNMVSSMKSVTITSSKLLSTAKSVSQDLNRPNAKNQLAAAARAVTDSINRLVDVCTMAAPGQKECAAALRSMEGARVLLDRPTQPLSDLNYFSTLDAVVDQSKLLSEGMSGMASSVKRSQHEEFARAVSAVATAVCGLVECAAQAAYLVAASDESSVPGRPGLVDQAAFARAQLAIDQACATLADTSTNQQQVLSAATVIARHTSALCNACRVASSRTTEPAAKRHFVQAAKDVANSTAALVKEIKALDTDYSQENRARCAAATGPLRDAVRSLCAFADSPEFASVPAKISPQAARQQDAILDCGRSIISGSCSMVEAAQQLALSPADRAQWQELAAHSKTVSDSIKSLVTNIREKAPGQRECGVALETLAGQLRTLDTAAIQIVAQELAPRTANTLQGYCEQTENSSSEMLELVEGVSSAACGAAERLGHAVVTLVSYAEPLTAGAVGAASSLTDSQAQTELLQHARTVLETLAALVRAAMDAGGNPRATGAHGEVSLAAQDARAALSELSVCVRHVATARGETGPLLDSLARSLSRLTENRMSLVGSSWDETDGFSEYQSRMAASAKELSRIANDMTACAATDAGRLVTLGDELVARYDALAQDSLGAAATTPNHDIAQRIRACVVELGECCGELVKAGGQCRLSAMPTNQRLVADNAKLVNEKVVAVLGALQAGARGTQACIDAAATIAAIISDLDTTILFASAGTLHSEKENDTFSDHRENILKTAKELVEDTKTLVGGAAGTQDQLAGAARSAVNTIVRLCEVVKGGAMSLGGQNPEPQVLLLHAARDVAAALRDLAAATTAAAGKHHQHPDMQRLKHAAKRLSETTKRWSIPVRAAPPPTHRRSLVGLRNEYNSCDSETDVFQSDQEEELVKLLDYSSQDDDVSPSVFHDDCEDVITYIVNLMKDPPKRILNDEFNNMYNIVAITSLSDMDWRVVKYGENILLGEIKKLVDLFIDYNDRVQNKRKRDMIQRLKATTVLDNEMKRLSQVIEDLDSEMEIDDNTEPLKQIVSPTQTVVSVKKPKLENNDDLKNASFKVRKVKPVKLELNIDLAVDIPKTNEYQKQNEGETKVVTALQEVKFQDVSTNNKHNIKSEFWKMFKDDSEWWSALAKLHLKKMEETRMELERFSGHELVLGEIQSQLTSCDKQKETLQSFIDKVDKSKSVKKDLEYDEKYKDMVLKLIEFAKRDFNYKGFDPLINKLNELSNIEIESRKRVRTNIYNIIDIYNHIDISKYSYEELCVLEKHYREIIKKFKKEATKDKENTVPRDERSPSLIREDSRTNSPSYHKNVILNINSRHNLTKNVDTYSTAISDGNTIKRSHTKNQNLKNNVEVYDLTRTYPIEYYANNWWSIYEDILKSREQQFGSIDNWWKFYEAILNKKEPTDEELSRLRSVVEYRNNLRKQGSSRMEEQLRMIDEVKNNKFNESELVTTQGSDATMVTNVTSLLKTVKAVEDEHTRGTRALEATIEAISQEIELLESSSGVTEVTATAEELVRCTRGMTTATARAVAAGNTSDQEQLTAAANLGRKTVVDMLHAAKGAARGAESAELGARTLAAGRKAAETYRALLSAVLAASSGDTTARQRFPELSRHVAASVQDILHCAEQLKGSDWVDPDDPTVIAESELLGAAASIDAAARKLDALRPRMPPAKVQEADETLNFDEMILEAAKSIIAATSALVRAASAAQRELIDQGAVARRPLSSSDDGQWSEGLVSAARLVAAAAHALVEAANALVQGAGSEERLISAARQVASSTAQLLVACKVKADPMSESTRRLQAAGAEVIRSTDNLVRAARDAITTEEERSLVLNRRMVGGIAQEIDARSEVLRIEKELEEARGRLSAIRQAKYRLRGDTSGDETDDGNLTLNRFPKTPTSSFVNTTYSPNSTFHTTRGAYDSTLDQNGLSVPPKSPGYVSSPSFNIQNQSSAYSPGYTVHSPSYSAKSPGFTAASPGFTAPSPGFTAPSPGFTSQSPGYTGQSTGYLTQSPGYTGQTQGYNQSHSYNTQNENYTQSSGYSAQTPGYTGQNVQTRPDDTQNGYSSSFRQESHTTATGPSFSSFRPEQPKQNYEGFTTRACEVVSTEQTAVITYRRERAPPPPPPPRRLPTNYETRLYDTPKPTQYRTEEQRQFESSQYVSQQDKFASSPLSPKFNARELKEPEPLIRTGLDGVGERFTEHQRATEAIPGGTRHTEVTVKRECYRSPVTTEIITKSEEAKPPFVTSTPFKSERSEFSKSEHSERKEVVRVPPPQPNIRQTGKGDFLEESSTEVKEIPNGTQKITTTKIYSSSPVSLTTTETRDEGDSRFSTLDSRRSDASRSFMRPSEFSGELAKPLDGQFSKRTVTSETIERKSVMTSSHKSETSSTVTKKFGNA